MELKDKEILFKPTKGMLDIPTHYCPGCTHGIIHSGGAAAAADGEPGAGAGPWHGPHGPAAPDPRARRPAGQLEAGDAGGCAQPFRDQHPARPA